MKPHFRFLSAVLTIASLSLTFAANSPAQAATKVIKYGDMVTGNLTDKQADVVYSFNAKKDDVIAVEYTSIAPKDKTLDFIVNVKDKSGNDVGFGFTILYAAPADMTYTITLSGISGTGKYVLKLIQAQPLTLGTPIKGTISYDKDKIPTSVYYYFNSTDPFTVKLDTPPVDTTASNTLQWGLVVRQADPTFNDYGDVFNYTDNRNVISSTAVTILGSSKVIALGVHPGGYSFGDNTVGAQQDFTLTVSPAK